MNPFWKAFITCVGHRGGIVGLGYATVWPMNINCHQPIKPCTLKIIHIHSLSKPFSMMSLMPFYLMAEIRFIRPLFSKEHQIVPSMAFLSKSSWQCIGPEKQQTISTSIHLIQLCSYIHNVFHVNNLLVTILPKNTYTYTISSLWKPLYFPVEKNPATKKPSQNSSPTFAVAIARSPSNKGE